MKYLILCFLTIVHIAHVSAQQFSSHYIEMPDGIKLAADVYLPKGEADEQFPVLVVLERYWRSTIGKKDTSDTPIVYGREKLFIENGYVIVIVDTRGSGASFGTRESEYSPKEVQDAKTVVDWIVAQPWSNGKVGSYGTSYTGTTAELLCATQHPAVKAVIPGWSDIFLNTSPVGT